MTHRLTRCVLLLALPLLFVSTARAELKIGHGATVITPQVGTPMAGYYFKRGAEGVHDDLYAKSLVLDDGTTRVAVVSLDLITTSRMIVDKARELIEQRTGIPGANVLISATHTHTGPTILRESRTRTAFGGSDDLAVKFSNEVPALIADSVEEAVKSLQVVEASWAIGRCEGVAFNRRFLLRDGTVGWNSGKLNPNIIKPAGPVDEDLPFLSFNTPKGQPVANFVNFPLHLDTIGGPMFSADIPGVVTRILQDARGKDVFTLYTTGCCGDVNHIDISHGRPQKGFIESARIGSQIAASALKAVNDLKAVENPVLRVSSKMVKLPAYPSTAEEIEASEAMIAASRDPNNPKSFGTLALAKAYRDADIKDRSGAPYEVEVQVITLGQDVAFVSLPGEIFVELGMTIRQASPYVCTTISELANGSIGYIPNRVAYPQGTYEVLSTRVAAGSGEILVDTALELLRDNFSKGVAGQK